MLGADETLVGEYDIAAKQQQMNALKAPTVAIARALLKGGQRVAADTIKLATGGLFERELPGITSLKKTQSHLEWHAAQLAPQTLSPMASYAPGDDLKKWVMQAYIDSNAAAEGRSWQDQAIALAASDWVEMWTEIGEELMKLPATIAQGVGKAVAQVAKAAASGLAGGVADGLGIPTWVLVAGGAALVVGVGVGVFKILLVTAPAVVPAVVGRYLR